MSILAQMVLKRPDIDIFQMLPLLIFAGLMVFALIFEMRDDESEDVSSTKGQRPAIVSVGVVALLALMGWLLTQREVFSAFTFNHMLVWDSLTRSSVFLIAFCSLMAILSGPEELERRGVKFHGEFVALIFASGAGMTLLAAADNTMVMFLGLELFSLALYLLCIFFPSDSNSRESGLKYFLLSSGASSVLLYGLALLYGATSTTWLSDIASSEVPPVVPTLLLTLGSILVLCGFLFKLAIVPFHSWAPDVYEGAPTTVTAFMSVATKVAAVAALWRFLEAYQGLVQEGALVIIIGLAALSIGFGSLMAVTQTRVKRMLAYSGIANAGFLLIAPAVGFGMRTPMMFFLAAYAVGNMGAFLCLALVEREFDRPVTLDDLRGLYHRRPRLAGCFAVCLLSLAGLPPAVGFLAKFFLFGQALAAGNLFLAAAGLAGSFVGAYYYLGTAFRMFMTVSPESEKDRLEPVEGADYSGTQLAVGTCALGVLILGVVPGPLLEWLSVGLF